MPREVVVYAGKGSSHSWTWLADLFEAQGYPWARFLDGEGLVRALRDDPSMAIVSGGDAYAMASALSGNGFAELRRYIDAGGKYVGVCAGAYLPLPTSVPPLNEFNLCAVKIENIAPSTPPLIEDSPRLSVPYCDRRIVHPVRGKMTLRVGSASLMAPVFGGPIFRESAEGRVIGRFEGLTESTEIQTSLEHATEIVVGRPAIVEARHGNGSILLLSPHLEHPEYPEANSVFLDLLGLCSQEVSDSVGLHRDRMNDRSSLSRAAADLSVAIRGLEGRAFLVGNKLWDVERLLVLSEAIRKRASHIVPDDANGELADRVEAVRISVVGLEADDIEGMESLLDTLTGVARDCVNLMFESARARR